MVQQSGPWRVTSLICRSTAYPTVDTLIKALEIFYLPLAYPDIIQTNNKTIFNDQGTQESSTGMGSSIMLHFSHWVQHTGETYSKILGVCIMFSLGWSRGSTQHLLLSLSTIGSTWSKLWGLKLLQILLLFWASFKIYNLLSKWIERASPNMKYVDCDIQRSPPIMILSFYGEVQGRTPSFIQGTILTFLRTFNA